MVQTALFYQHYQKARTKTQSWSHWPGTFLYKYHISSVSSQEWGHGRYENSGCGTAMFLLNPWLYGLMSDIHDTYNYIYIYTDIIHIYSLQNTGAVNCQPSSFIHDWQTFDFDEIAWFWPRLCIFNKVLASQIFLFLRQHPRLVGYHPINTVSSTSPLRRTRWSSNMDT